MPKFSKKEGTIDYWLFWHVVDIFQRIFIFWNIYFFSQVILYMEKYIYSHVFMNFSQYSKKWKWNPMMNRVYFLKDVFSNITQNHKKLMTHVFVVFCFNNSSRFVSLIRFNMNYTKEFTISWRSTFPSFVSLISPAPDTNLKN